MVNGMTWVACVSQTGSELVAICNATGLKPDAVLCTNIDKLRDEVFRLDCPVFVTRGRPGVDQYEYFFRGAGLITLHGFLYIIPREVCESLSEAGCKVYNGHPALLSMYPELKGKDKQEDAYYRKASYPWMGSVIHECTAELDAGKLLFACKRVNSSTSVEDAYLKLRDTSLATWLRFFYHVQNAIKPWNITSLVEWELV